MKQILSILCAALLLIVAACNDSLVIRDVNFSQPVESVVTPDTNGVVHDKRYGLVFNILPVQYAEFGDSVKPEIKYIRLIRNQEGYYFITAEGFKHVYVMRPEKGKLVLNKRLRVSDKALTAPVFNLRPPFIQLVETKTNTVYALDEKQIHKKEKQS